MYLLATQCRKTRLSLEGCEDFRITISCQSLIATVWPHRFPSSTTFTVNDGRCTVGYGAQTPQGNSPDSSLVPLSRHTPGSTTLELQERRWQAAFTHPSSTVGAMIDEAMAVKLGASGITRCIGKCSCGAKYVQFDLNLFSRPLVEKAVGAASRIAFTTVSAVLPRARAYLGAAAPGLDLMRQVRAHTFKIFT
ncbi:hypothetical protein C8R45DRAFT_998961 [Mycena sanguinolenta]|nr:hypothetical protein C8R45DRAFT_998961 [Mycena sanguinolenta]